MNRLATLDIIKQQEICISSTIVDAWLLTKWYDLNVGTHRKVPKFYSQISLNSSLDLIQPAI